MAVLGVPGFHNMEVALPVTRPVFLGDDDLQGLAEHLVSTPTEHGFRARIPQPYNALPITKNDGDRDLLQNAFAEQLVSRDAIHREPQGIPNEYLL